MSILEPDPTAPLRVVVGVDGADGGRDALALAQALGAGPALLVGVFPMRNHVAGIDALGDTDAVRAAALRGDLDAAAAGHGLADAELCPVTDERPADAIVAAAVSHEADLIVLGSSRRGALGRLFLGDVGREVLRCAPCPVAFAPAGYAEHAVEPRRLVAGYDGRDGAEPVLETAVALADRLAAALTVVVACAPLPASLRGAAASAVDVQGISEQERHAKEELLARTLERLPGRVAGRLEEGAAATVLVRLSQEVDLVVVGRRPRAHRLGPGGPSDALAHGAACPVVVVGSATAATGATARHVAAER
ncbi:universal stress protein [Conexibacter sp. SYSU D00693]|uniref:universal stress protein n=1 Tax=Conexibacter sp. SYSU D00693 TaxID=2812560 RepID=UPI00196A762B|nr:universal stress protein [Conexibacter sp. SYSU D00693]